jgi:hypothetical protein
MATNPASTPAEHMRKGLEHLHKTHKAARAEAERLAAERKTQAETADTSSG